MGGIEDFKKKVKDMADKAREKAQAEESREGGQGRSDVDRLKERLSETEAHRRHGGEHKEP